MLSATATGVERRSTSSRVVFLLGAGVYTGRCGRVGGAVLGRGPQVGRRTHFLGSTSRRPALWNLAEQKADGSRERQDCCHYPTTRTKRLAPRGQAETTVAEAHEGRSIRVMCAKLRPRDTSEGCVCVMRFEEWRGRRRRGLHGGALTGLRARQFENRVGARRLRGRFLRGARVG